MEKSMHFDPDVERAKQYIGMLIFFIVAFVVVSVHQNTAPTSEAVVEVTR
jgi:hypothetical protein